MPSKFIFNSSYSAYKKFEIKLNNIIKGILNSQRVFAFVKDFLDIHLNQLAYQKSLMKSELNSKGYANKEEIAIVAKKFISNEARIDELEDKLYIMAQNWNSKKQTLVSFKEILNEFNLIINAELKEDRI